MMVDIYPQDGESTRQRTCQIRRGHLWGIILAGGEGKRLQPFIQACLGCDRPKQYCAFIDNCSMLRRTIRRAERIISPERLLTVVINPHLPYVKQQLCDRPSETIIVQPCNRETAPGILLPLLHVYQRDPQAIVAILPSDHFILEEEPLID
jgi:mannose-1-phosphate guanylyltransferase